MGLKVSFGGTVIARVTTNVWFDPYIVFKKGLEQSPLPYFIDYIVKLCLFLLTGAAAYYLSSLIPNTSIIYVVIKAAVAFIISNIVFLLIYGRKSEFKYLWNVGKLLLQRKMNV